ncbi:MAG: hypothetical protein Ct9H90mP2_11710 [Dehalococcoidia bacterium]|nr:MAG: hypothetical protein Ct9H90mP2_11710 [Dehalococcoidia bacterium]
MISGGTANLQFTMVSGMARIRNVDSGTKGTIVVKTETTDDPVLRH